MDHSENDKRFCVYVHKDQDGTVRYVGSGIRSRHFSRVNRTKEHLSIWDSLIKEIVKENLTKEEANHYEEYLLEKFWYSGQLLNKVKKSMKIVPISYDFISKYLSYDESSPTKLRWLKEHKPRNKKQYLKDSVAGTQNKNYYYISLEGFTFLAHRVIYTLNTKEDLQSNVYIDHIDRNSLNNCFSNLRKCTSSENAFNRKVRNTSRTGIAGVTFYERNKVWAAEITIRGVKTRKTFNPRTLFPELSEEEANKRAFELAVEFRKQKELELYNAA